MKKANIEIMCYLEGVEVPVGGVNVHSKSGAVVSGTIQLRPVKEASLILPKTMVAVFFKINNDEWKLLFDGETIGEPGYQKQNGRTYVTLNVLGFNRCLNDAPAHYLNQMNLDYTEIKDDYLSLFYGFHIDDVGDMKIDNMAYALSYGSLKSEYMTLLGFFSKFLSNVVGGSISTLGGHKLIQSPIMQYLYFQGMRYIVEKSHLIIDTGVYDKLKKGEEFRKYIGSLVKKISLTQGKTLDSVLKAFRTIGYNYVSNPRPPLGISDVEKDRGSANIGKKEVDGFNMMGDAAKKEIPKFIVMPGLQNVLPPMCNYVEVDGMCKLNVNPSRNMLTRIINKFASSGFGYNLPLVAMYPKEGDWDVLHNKKHSYGFMGEEEQLNGIHGHSLTEAEAIRDLFDIQALDNEGVPAEEKKSAPPMNRNTSELMENLTQFRYFNIKHAGSSASVSMPWVNPYLVAGLPALLKDKDTDFYFYGDLEEISISIIIDSPSVSTNFKVVNVRKVEKMEDIVQDEDGKSISMPFLPSSHTGIDYESVAKLRKDIYYRMLGGAVPTPAKYGGILPVGERFEKRQIALNVNLDKLKENNKRPIVTFNEYWARYIYSMKGGRRAGVNLATNHSMEAKMVENPEAAHDKIRAGTIFIKERVARVEAMKRRLEEVVIDGS